MGVKNEIFEVKSGELAAVGMLVHENIMNGQPGPLVFPTMNKTRVILAFNEQLFQDRATILERRILRERPEIDPKVARRQSEHGLVRVMGRKAISVLDVYFQLTEVDHLAEKVDEDDSGSDGSDL